MSTAEPVVLLAYAELQRASDAQATIAPDPNRRRSTKYQVIFVRN